MVGRARVQMKLKLKGRRRDFTKKVRVLCDYCGVSSSSRFDQRTHTQHHEAVSLASELKRLRLLTRRMTGKDLDGLSFPELLFLESHLKEILLIVKDRKKQMVVKEDERLRKQKKEAGDGDEGTRRRVLAPCKFSGSSSGERREKQDDEAPALSKTQIEFERRNGESMEMEFQRLWLLKERMNGRELIGMNSSELCLLEDKIKCGLLGLHEQLFGPRMEQLATQRKEELISQLRGTEERL